MHDAWDFRNVLLVERENGDFGVTMMQQFLFDAWHIEMLRALCHSSHARISEIAVKALKEVSYHLEKSADIGVRLGDGPEESHRRMQDALNGLWIYKGELFIDDEVDDYVDANKIAPKASSLKDKGLAIVEPILREAKLTIFDNNYVHKGGKRGIHSEYLGHMLAQMQYLQRAYPNSTW